MIDNCVIFKKISWVKPFDSCARFILLILYTVHQFKMREEQTCKVGCRIKLDAAAAKNYKEKIGDEYRVNM